jgi:phospholipid transport system substrate-binding protein
MILRTFLAFWMLALVSIGVRADVIQDAKKTVDHLNQELIGLMRGGKQLGYEGRLKKIDPTVRQSFMFEAVAQIALGTHWKKLDEAQKLQFMDKYRELSSATYASQFKEYEGEAFEFESGQELKPGRVVIRYNLVAPKERHGFEYHMSLFNGEWRVVNIVVDGISDLALRKAQYTSVIDREGFDALISKLTQKIADTAKNNAT